MCVDVYWLSLCFAKKPCELVGLCLCYWVEWIWIHFDSCGLNFNLFRWIYIALHSRAWIWLVLNGSGWISEWMSLMGHRSRKSQNLNPCHSELDAHTRELPGTIRHLARSGTWHDLVHGTTWQIWYLARSGTWHDLVSGIWYPYIYIHIYIYGYIQLIQLIQLQWPYPCEYICQDFACAQIWAHAPWCIWIYMYMYCIYIWIYIYIWIPGTRFQIVPGTRSARSCQVPDRARYLIVPGTVPGLPEDET